jgi:hypothetical protein
MDRNDLNKFKSYPPGHTFLSISPLSYFPKILLKTNS